MEVHSHTHTARKKWYHYFWEFFMLFLAVTLGFLVENQREHYVEHLREKEYIRSMVADLQDDTAILSKNITAIKSGAVLLDSLITVLDDKHLIKESGDQLYYFGRVGPRLGTFSNNNRTFEQLKNSGGFRLIRNDKSSSKIIEYYNAILAIRQLEDIYTKEFEEYKVAGSKIFEPAVFRMMEAEGGQIKRGTTNPPLRTYDPELLKELSVFAVYMNGSRKGLILFQENLRKKGIELIELLKKEYPLE